MSGMIPRTRRGAELLDRRVRSANAVTNTYGSLVAGRLIVYIEIFAVVGAGAITVTIQEKVPDSENTVNILSSASLNSAGVTRLEVGPGITVVANKSAAVHMGANYRISVAFSGSGSDSVEYQITAVEPTI